jgi:hypothetical protein
MATKKKAKQKPRAKALAPAKKAKPVAKRRATRAVKKAAVKASPRKAAAKAGRAAKKASAKRSAKPATKPAVRATKPAVRATKPAVRATKPAVRATKPAVRAARPAAKKARTPTPIRRRDGSGHLDPQYAADLRAKSGRPEPEPTSFVQRPRSNDDLVEELGEEVIGEATSAEHEGGDILDQEVPEERGGPFVETTGAEEFGHGVDPSNPPGAKREPFPTT